MAQITNPSGRRASEGIAPECSIVIPLCNEAENLPRLHERLMAVLRALTVPYEIIYVDDGSTDETAALIESLHEGSALVKGLFLSRNFGHQAALTAGLEVASGRAVISMDGDLQDPPELIPQMLARWQEGARVVYARRGRRRGSLLKRAAYHVFYRLLRGLSDLPIPLDTGDYALIDEEVLAVLNGLPERNRFIRGLRTWVGFKQAEVVYDREDRQAGKTKYTFKRLFGLALDGLLGFSSAPVRVVGAAGCLVTMLAIVGLGLACAGVLPVDRATLLISAVLVLLGGVQLMGTGIVAEYACRAYVEARGRPLYAVARRIGLGSRIHPTRDFTHFIRQERDAAGQRRLSPALLEERGCRLVLEWKEGD